MLLKITGSLSKGSTCETQGLKMMTLLIFMRNMKGIKDISAFKAARDFTAAHKLHVLASDAIG